MSSLHRVARFPKPAATATTDPTNMGTYNYCGEYVQDGQISLSGAKHAIFDILPYETYGNTTPADKPDKEYSSSKNKDRYAYDDEAKDARKAFLGQYRTIQVCGLRKQFFRQIGRNFRRDPAGFQENFGQYGGNKCKQGVRRELRGVALEGWKGNGKE